MTDSVRVGIEELSQISKARRVAVEMADSIDFDEVRTGQVAIVATEVGTNILKHARRGEILVHLGAEPAPPFLELLALDRGPGMSDLDRCLADGFTTGISAGQGMGAIRRLSTESDFYSLPNEGTAVLA